MSGPSSREEGFLYVLAAVGAMIGLGKLLQSNEKVTLRKVFGHGIVSGGLGGSASLLLIPFPEVPTPVLIGLACALSAMGTQTLAMLFQKYIEKR